MGAPTQLIPTHAVVHVAPRANRPRRRAPQFDTRVTIWLTPPLLLFDATVVVKRFPLTKPTPNMASDNNNNNFEELLAMCAFPFRVNGRPLIPPPPPLQAMPISAKEPHSKQPIQGLNHWREAHNIICIPMFCFMRTRGRVIQYNVLAIISLFAEFNPPPPPTHHNNKIICIFICFITSIKGQITKGSMVAEWVTGGPKAHPELTLIII